MSSNLQTENRSGRALMIVGLIGLVAGFIWLLALADPFPMWLIISGFGLVFIGSGAAVMRNSHLS